MRNIIKILVSYLTCIIILSFVDIKYGLDLTWWMYFLFGGFLLIFLFLIFDIIPIQKIKDILLTKPNNKKIINDKNDIIIMKETCFNYVDSILNTLEQYDDFKNKKIRVIEIYFFILSFISYIFYTKRSNSYVNNQTFKLFLSEVFGKICSIYRINSMDLKKGANEFILHYNDRKNQYIASFNSDLTRHQAIYSETIFDFLLNLYTEIDHDELVKITIPLALQLTSLIATCHERL
ncbi:MAG: hypothetical protein WCD80_00370 [Desulfobaccales bacterium]